MERRVPESWAVTPTVRIGSSIPAIIECRDTEPRCTTASSTFVGRSEGPPRPPVLPPARPVLAFPPGGASPPAGLVHEGRTTAIRKLSAKTLQCLCLRDKHPPKVKCRRRRFL